MQKQKTKHSLRLRRKLVMTGGHAATTALATFEALDHNKWSVSWIGSKRAVEGKSAQTIEFKIFPKYGITCYSLVAGRLQRKWTRYTLSSLVKIPVGFIHAFFLLLRLRPKAVISFGGFVALPVVVSAWVMRIPVIIHEQTIAIGLANKMSQHFAKKIALARDGSRKYFPPHKSVVTGNPVRKAFFEIKAKSKLDRIPVIYATGGSRGSQNFNKFLFQILPELVREFHVIHQCGDIDFEKAKEVKAGISKELKKRYEVYGTISPEEVPDMFDRADIITGRSGANTVAEVIASGKRAIFIPIPWTQHDEQTKNAKLAVAAGTSVVLSQNDLTPELFLNTIYEVRDNWEKMKLRNSKIRDLDMKASENLSALIESTIK